MTHTRRQFFRTIPAFGAFALAGQASTADAQSGPSAEDREWPAPPPTSGPVDDFFPSHHPALAKEMVLVSHGNVARVRALVNQHAELAKASWDWGFGDWETALGAASHVGSRAIAELLLERGAPPTLFSAAMLGQLQVVEALLAATPGLQRMRGPHGLTLMVHARKGGPQAARVVTLLESLGDADVAYANEPLTPDERASIEGRYTFGDRPRDQFVVSTQGDALMLGRVGVPARGLFHRGRFAFHAAGAEGPVIQFQREGSRTIALTISDPDLVVRARKV